LELAPLVLFVEEVLVVVVLVLPVFVLVAVELVLVDPVEAP
jgi:hypothetical protein